MNVQISSTQFNHFLKESKVINTESILIDATCVVELVKCDVDNQISCTIDALIKEDGSVILPKEIFPLVKDGELMTITDNSITVGSRTISLDLEKGKDYPRIDDDFKYNVFELDDKKLRHLLEVEHAISEDKTKPILNGIRIENNRFIAIDGYRFSERMGEFKSDIPITISNYKMLKSLKGNIKATCSDRYIKYQVHNYNFYNRLLEGDFIQIDKLKPREFNTTVEIDKFELLDVLNGAMNLVSKVKNQLVKFSIRKGVIHISANNKTETKNKKEDEKRKLNIELEDSIKCDTSGDNLDIAFNCKYLIDSIKKMDKSLKMSFTTNVNPVIIESLGKYEMILPVRVASKI